MTPEDTHTDVAELTDEQLIDEYRELAEGPGGLRYDEVTFEMVRRFEERADARTTIETSGDGDWIEIEGITERTVAVDYYEDNDAPRLLVYADVLAEEPSHIIDLPPETDE